MERVNSPHRDEERYRITTLLCIAAALSMALLLVKFWPDFEDRFDPNQIFDTRGDQLELEMVEQTEQVAKPPPPPAPVPPVIVPDDTILEFEEVEITEDIEVDGDDIDVASAASFGPKIVAQADQGPKPIRFVEPEYTEQALKEKVKATIHVEVLIDETGRVIETKIIDRFLHEKKNEPPVPVRRVGFGIEEAAVGAAERWRFRPAKHAGRTVQTYYTLTFRFGV